MRRIYYEQEPRNDGVFWFQDTRTGCEKQTIYFEKIRQLDLDLITKEEKHLVNAMERLKQLRFPRRKPVVPNKTYKCEIKYEQNCQKVKRSEDRATKQCEKSAIYLKAKQIAICTEDKNTSDSFRRKSSTRKKLHRKTKSSESHTLQLDCMVTKIPDGKTQSKRVPIFDVLFPSLPCIPNVGHKTNIEVENRLRILELANGEFENSTLPAQSNVSRKGKKKIEPKSEKLVREMVVSSMNDSKAPSLAAIFDDTPADKMFSTSLRDEGVSQKEETEVKSSGCEREIEENTRQPPPPTRVNSGQSTAESNDNMRQHERTDTKIKGLECGSVMKEDTRQPPSPTRVNSHKSSVESIDSNNQLRVTIKN